MNAVTASHALNAVTASHALNAVTASYIRLAASASNALSASYALNASNATSASYSNFAITSSFASNAANASTASFAAFASTASNAQTLAPGTTVSASNIYVNNNLFVAGTASFGFLQTVTGSAVIIGEQFIVLNADSPISRYSGIQIYDTGSASTASFEWDGVRDNWIIVEETGLSAIVLTGPTGSKGSEAFPTPNALLKGTGHHTVFNSNISDNGSIVSINSNTQITGSLIVSAGVTANLTGTSSFATSASYAGAASNATSASFATSAANATTASHAVNAVSTSFATTATAVVATVTGTNNTELVRGNMADNDQFRILVGGTGTNAGFVEIATADDGTEPIHVRQYTGVFSSLTRTATLLDGSGNTSFPGTVSAAFSGNLTGTATSASHAVFAVTSSHALNAVTASRALNANTASFILGTSNAFVQGGNSFGTTALLGTNDTQDLSLETNGSVRMTISSSNGFVGIGVANPATLLGLAGSTSPNFGLSLQPSGWNNARHRFTVPVSGDTSMWSFNWDGSVIDSALYSVAAINVTQGVITFSTTGSANAPTERMRINSVGNVGIGTSNPTSKLSITGTGNFTGNVGINTTSLVNALTVGSPLRLDGGTNSLGATVIAGPISTGSNDFTFSSAILRIQGSDATNNLQFGVGNATYNFHPWIQGSFDNSAGSNAFGAKDILLNPLGGNVGINTSEPNQYGFGGQILAVNGGTSYTNLILAGDANSGIAFGTSTGRLGQITMDSSIGLQLFSQGTGNSLTMVLNRSGNVGIGTTAPDGRLDIQSSSTGAVLSRIWNTNTSGTGASVLRIANSGNNNDGGRIEFSDASYYTATIAGDRTQGLTFRTSATGGSPTGISIRMAILPDGNVGIGTTSPTDLLDIYASSGTPAIRLSGAGVGTNTYRITGQLIGISNTGFGIYDNTNSIYRLVINGSGNVGIATTSPVARLHIGPESSAGTNTPTIIASSPSGSRPSILFTEFGFRSGIIGYTTSNYFAMASEEANAGNGIQFITRGNFSGTGGLLNNGRIAMTINNDGNVGIGTVTVNTKFHVFSNIDSYRAIRIQASASTGDAGIEFIGSGGNIFNIQQPGSAAGLFFYDRTNTSTRMTIDGNGNVGIGTTLPTADLHVYENNDVWHTRIGGASGELRIGGQNGSGAVIQAYTPAGTVRDLYIQRDGGSVGIGTTTPSRQLDITGTLRVQTGTIDFSNNFNNQIWVLSSAMNFKVNGSERMIINSNGNIGINTTSPDQLLRINGTAGQPGTTGTTQNGIIRMVGWTTGSVSGYGETLDMGFHIGLSGPPSYAWLQATNWSGLSITYNLVLNPNGGNVGIGTTTPTSDLHVYDNSDVWHIRAGGASGQLRIGGQNGSGAVIGAYTPGDISRDLYIQRDGGNVGIGTTAPVAKLDVSGTGRFSSNLSTFSQLRLEPSAGGSIVVGSRSSQVDFQLYNTGNVFRIYDGTRDALNINTSGNVGIGTTAPLQLFHVRGADASFDGGSGAMRFYVNRAGTNVGSIIFTTGGPGTANGWAEIGQTDVNGDLYFKANPSAGDFTTRMVIQGSSGSVGIGTTIPLAQLEVEVPSSTDRGGIFLDMTSGGGGAIVLGLGSNIGPYIVGNTLPNGNVRGAYGGSRMGFNSGGFSFDYSSTTTGARSWSTYMTLNSNGNLGIGTTSATQALHVVGNVYIDDNDTTGNGVILGTGDRPLITRGWDAFTSGNKNGIGRWGVYMESAELFIGCPGTDYVNGLVTIGGWLVGGTRQPNLTVNNGTRRVGIGTDIPTHQLSINRATEAAAYQININSAGGVSTGNFTGIRFSQDSGAATELGNIKLNYFTDGSTSLSLGTRYATSAILIESSTNGSVGIGSTAPAFKLDVNGPGRFVSNSSSRVLYLVQDATNAGNIIQFRNQSNTDIGEIVYRNNQFYIYSNAISGYIMYGDPATGNVGIGYGTTSYKLDVSGTIRATGDVIAYSDARVKDNVTTVENALDKVKSLRGVTYTRKDIDDKSEKVGVIAQEVLEVLPQVVSQDSEGQYSVAYGNMVGVLIEAIKEQQKQIDELKYLLQTQNK